MKTTTLKDVVATFGEQAKQKLSNPVATGEPEDQLRAPFEQMLAALAALCSYPKGKVIAVGESAVRHLKTRPDYAVTVHGALVGFVELKAPGKGADPRKYKDAHDREQWERLRLLPSIIYTDGNAFSLWHNGELEGSIVKLDGDIETAGTALAAPSGLLALFESFFAWEPQPPRTAKDLAHVSARLCRLLRDEVTEQLALKSEALTGLATDWRKLLFPDATDERFADGYAQAVTFGLLMARARGISLAKGFEQVAVALGQTSTLIGAALRLLTENAANQATLKTSMGTLQRVLEVVDWPVLSKGSDEAWLYFYEDFLEVYDNELRKQTGSYYTPPEVVDTMVRLVDEALRSPRFSLHGGLASSQVTLVDPATGTGTFLLGVLRQIAGTIAADQGEGAVKAAIADAVQRLIAFEIQLGPFAVAQLRILAEIVTLSGAQPTKALQMFVTDTLSNPNDDAGWIPQLFAPIAKSRRAANRVKRETPVTVVLGNPPYKEKAKGKGGWVEVGDPSKQESAPLETWMPPSAWGVGAHSKHLRNLYVYFWRWASWKVFDHGPGSKTGIVCYITVAGFLGGPGFQRMRDYLRRTCDDIWVIYCTPEGLQPEVNTRIFQGVQQPVCIVLASRSAKNDPDAPARVRFRSLPTGHRDDKFAALVKITLEGAGWLDASSGWRAPFLPESTGAWAGYPALEDFFTYNGSGVMPGRTWIIAPDAESLLRRWKKLIDTTDAAEKEKLFHPHLRGGQVGDKHTGRVVKEGLAGFPVRPQPIAHEKGSCEQPIPYPFRSFDRQWIIPDNRLINQPNPGLWEMRSQHQIYLTAPSDRSPNAGPALTVAAHVPDLHHYNGRGGRVFPLWANAAASQPNVHPALLTLLSDKYGFVVSAADVVAYIAAIASNPAYTAKFQDDLSTPGLRIPLTAERARFREAVDVGARVIWLHTFGERMSDTSKGRSAKLPRLPEVVRPSIPKEGTIPQSPDAMPDDISYDVALKRLKIGGGFINNVPAEVWNYEVSGKQVLLQWFSYRKKNRERPIIGDRRKPSPLGDVQPDHWLAEYTTDLLNILNVLGLLVEMEPAQASLLEKICSGPLITNEALKVSGVTASDTPDPGPAPQGSETGDLFG